MSLKMEEHVLVSLSITVYRYIRVKPTVGVSECICCGRSPYTCCIALNKLINWTIELLEHDVYS